MQVLQKINKYISQILKVALIACFTYMTVVLSLQVFGRYLFHKGFSWTEETARYIMIWAVFLGAAYIALNLEHVKVSIIEDLMKKQKHKQILELVQHLSLIHICFYRSVFPKKRCDNKNNCKKQMCCN